MSAANNGGPAFPDSVAVGPAGDVYGSTGMSLRDYFAAKVLNAHAMYHENGYSLQKTEHREMLARDCYAMADAMLAERAK